MPWKFGTSENPNNPEAPNTPAAGTAPTVPEKTQAELLAEAMGPVITAIQSVTSKVEALEGRFPATRQPEPGETKPQFASVFEDEDSAIGQRVVAALTPVYQQQLEMQADINREKVLKEFEAKGFGSTLTKFADRINTLLDGTPLVQPDGKGQMKPYRGDKEYIRNIINMVIGEAAAAAGLRVDGKNGNFFIESAGGGAEGGSGAVVNDGLTEGQRKVFNRMGIPLKDGAATVGKLKFLN